MHTTSIAAVASQNAELAELANRARALLSLTDVQTDAFVASARRHAARFDLDPVQLARESLERTVALHPVSGPLLPANPLALDGRSMG